MSNESIYKSNDFTTLGTDLLHDKTGQVVESFKLNLEKARDAMEQHYSTGKSHSVMMQMSKAFNAADRIIRSSLIVKH